MGVDHQGEPGDPSCARDQPAFDVPMLIFVVMLYKFMFFFLCNEIQTVIWNSIRLLMWGFIREGPTMRKLSSDNNEHRSINYIGAYMLIVKGSIISFLNVFCNNYSICTSDIRKYLMSKLTSHKCLNIKNNVEAIYIDVKSKTIFKETIQEK